MATSFFSVENISLGSILRAALAPTQGKSPMTPNRIFAVCFAALLAACSSNNPPPAKTGTISRVNALSGFVDRPDGSTLIFSIQANHQTIGGARMLAAIDSVVVELGKSKGRRK